MIKYFFVLASIIYNFSLSKYSYDIYIILILYHIMFIVFFIGVDIAGVCNKATEYLKVK